MPGFSITLLRLPTEKEKSAPPATLILSLLDEKPDVPGWKWSSGSSPLPLPTQITPPYKQEADAAPLAKLKSLDSNAFLENIKRAAHGLITAEPDITRMDSIGGDGDCGLTLKVLSKPFDDIESCLTSADRPALKVRGFNDQTFWFAEFYLLFGRRFG
jgi:dihydroxyacetone kinase